MVQTDQDPTNAEITALKTRWHEKDPDGEATVLQKMVHRLKTECAKGNLNRPLKLDLRGITLQHEDLSGLDLSGYDWSYARLEKSKLKDSNLSYSVFHKAALDQTVLDESEFAGSDLTHVNMNECSAKRSGFGGADLSYASMIHSDLISATFSRSKLIHADLRASNLKKARLSETDLSWAIFTRAKMHGSDLKKSDVKGTNFELADLRQSRLLAIKNFKKAKWVGADIRDLDPRGAYLVRRHIADENYLYEFQMISSFHRALYLIWWASSDCGRSLLRWFICLISVTLFFAGIYTQVNIDYGEHVTIFSPIYFSFVTLTTLGYGDAVPASIAAQFFVTLQAVTGYMGLGGLLSILGNKMA
ncbi:MAG: pentapeptide repeat-containing protein, partial [Desulfobacterales bacterium]|nr:pentapeptide repeat-containing protein [Desulfobacterales bacterium]